MHGVDRAEAEYVVDNTRRPYPLKIDRGKRLVWGQTPGGDYIQVIYLAEEDDVIFVIHARPLTDAEKRRLRRRRQ